MTEKLKLKFENYNRAINTFIEVMDEPLSSKLALAGFIKHFEFTLELSWKILKFFLEEKDIGETLIGSKDTIRAAYRNGLLSNPEIWLIMIRERNNTSHMYEEDFVHHLVILIKEDFFPEFLKLRETLKQHIEV